MAPLTLFIIKGDFMIISFYNNSELSYSGRKRYKNIDRFEPYAIQEQFSVLYGDGANTTMKVTLSSINNIIPVYVTIDGTRWFVVSYVYLNGGQVQLTLQRDVLGEFGLDNVYGKIERGYTETVLRNRKELSLNQILKRRIQILPDTFQYGNYKVNTHINEMWGVLYFVKPTEINPSTGEPYPEQVNINIPAFSPQTVDYTSYPNDTFVALKSTKYQYNMIIDIGTVLLKNGSNDFYVYKNCCIKFTDKENYIVDFKYSSHTDYIIGTEYNMIVESSTNAPAYMLDYILSDIAASTIDANKEGAGYNYGIQFPVDTETIRTEFSYNNVVILENGKYYKYTETSKSKDVYGNVSVVKFNSMWGSYNSSYGKVSALSIKSIISKSTIDGSILKKNELTLEEQGVLTINTSQTLIDEPYSVLVFPLFDVTISSVASSDKYVIEKRRAFSIFNTVIQYLSGENPYIVDAQIYPYCPVLTGIASSLQGYPFFSIDSNTYIHNCTVNPRPNVDIKKCYIEEQFSIVSPEKTGKFTFDYYDYVNKVVKDGDTNSNPIVIKVKTALKPYSIIASAVIVPEEDTLAGITYDADLKGCQPASGGFECSLSSNAFETYRRQNSNYQQIFNLQQQELQKQHEVERVNEVTSAVVNTISATTMGAIAGASVGGGTGIKAGIGAAVGGAAAGVTVGTAMAIQAVTNEGLRQYEEDLQKQMFDLQIGTVKNLPNTISRISTFNEIITKDFWFVLEVYQCTDYEKTLVNEFIEKYGYGLGVFGFYKNFYKKGWFLRGTIITSDYMPILQVAAQKDLNGGIYYNDTE